VHRNITNLVVNSELNCPSVIQFAVEVLKVEHVMVVGHYGCGGVQAVVQQQSVGLAENWLGHVEDIVHNNADQLDGMKSSDQRSARLCELKVTEQVANVCRTTILRRAWHLMSKSTKAERGVRTGLRFLHGTFSMSRSQN